VIIGHTHHARIAVRQMPDGSPFTLLDAGAWIENWTETKARGVPERADRRLSNNQIRIYQLDPREDRSH